MRSKIEDRRVGGRVIVPAFRKIVAAFARMRLLIRILANGGYREFDLS